MNGMNKLHVSMNAFLAGMSTGAFIHGWSDGLFADFSKDDTVSFHILFEEDNRSVEEEDGMAEDIRNSIVKFLGEGFVACFKRTDDCYEFVVKEEK